MQIKKIIAELFSEEMAEYLIKNISDINKYDIVNAICDAPVSIERKIEMLESLVGTKIDKKDKNGDYQNIIDYTFAKGMIMYFEYINCRKERYSYTELFSIDFSGFRDLNVPTLFRPGDVVLIDFRPFAPSEPVLVLENFDNRDCCGLQAIFFDENGKFDTGAIKHAHISPTYRTNRLSALYRIKKVDYTFKGEKQILERIRNYIKNDDVKAREIWNCINGYSSDKKMISSVKEMEEFLKIREKKLC